MCRLLEPVWTVCDCVRTVWVACGVIYALNCVVMCIRPEMAIGIGFKKWKRC